MKDDDTTLEAQGQPKYHTVTPATIVCIPHDKAPFYMSCPVEVPDDRNPGKSRPCYKRVDPPAGRLGAWVCPAGHECKLPKARWILNLLIADQTGQQYVSGFDEMSEKLIGLDCSEFAALWERRDTDEAMSQQVEDIFRRLQFTRWWMRMRSKKEVWNDEERVKVTLVDGGPLDLVKQSRAMLGDIRKVYPELVPVSGLPSSGGA